MATGAGKKQSREEKERARVYQARQEFHDGLIARRRRDNVIAGVAGGLLILAIVGAQVAYVTVGPGTPVPSPTATSTPTPEETLPGAPQPTEAPAPQESAPAATPEPTTAP
ncbi:dioxygenase [Microbacterium flavum]|uniref:dioxygenase n=1 Tax=Microbacterium flavum TaxID=415216 RepID=UPI001FE36A31|nr:dioxygenase [Microbacterium flavum]